MIDDMELSSSDLELMTDINAAIVRFIQSDETNMQMDPMNSYRRRMVHKIGTEYKLSSESTDEGENRSVRLSKTATTKIPENKKFCAIKGFAQKFVAETDFIRAGFTNTARSGGREEKEEEERAAEK